LFNQGLVRFSRLFMGCKQTTTKSPSIVFPSSLTEPTPPVYVKSALKKQRKSERRFDKLSSGKRKVNTNNNKSVIFNEKVQVKLRTPTPKETRYRSVVVKDGFKQKPVEDDDIEDESASDDDDQVSVVSSHDEPINEQKRTIKNTPNSLLQRNQPNGSWYKNSTVTVLSSPTMFREKPQPPPQQQLAPAAVRNTNLHANEEPMMLSGNRFRIRRKVPDGTTPQSPVVPIQPTTTSQTHVFIQRPALNPNPILIEHPVTYSTDGSPTQTGYYAINRRPQEKK